MHVTGELGSLVQLQRSGVVFLNTSNLRIKQESFEAVHRSKEGGWSLGTLPELGSRDRSQAKLGSTRLKDLKACCYSESKLDEIALQVS